MASDRSLIHRGSGLLAGLSLLAALAFLVGGCLPKRGQFEGIAPMKRNEVELVRMTHDVRFGEDGLLSPAEQERLDAFLTTAGIGYGDVLQLDDPHGAAGTGKAARRDAIARLLVRHGLWLAPGDAVMGLRPEAGTVRLVVSRHTVTSPGCPDWSQPSIKNWHNGQSSNFGCASATNIGAMIADPSELLDGAAYAGPQADKATSAVEVFRKAKPSGSTPLNSATGGSSSASSN
ncbi:MAG: hypothetical protein D6782_08270 [Alphaproteobacteria bacterium]|nr:MAG: hypothetical protein D6782_08270 [Alphaproteobacteria bacterium]